MKMSKGMSRSGTRKSVLRITADLWAMGAHPVLDFVCGVAHKCTIGPNLICRKPVGQARDRDSTDQFSVGPQYWGRDTRNVGIAFPLADVDAITQDLDRTFASRIGKGLKDVSRGTHPKRNDLSLFDMVARHPWRVYAIETNAVLPPQDIKRCALFCFCDNAVENGNDDFAQVKVLTKQGTQLPKRRTKSIVSIAVADQITEALERDVEPQDSRFGQASPVSKVLERERRCAVIKGIQHRERSFDGVYAGEAVVDAAFAAVRLYLFGSSFGHFTPFGQPERILALNGCGAISRCGKYATRTTILLAAIARLAGTIQVLNMFSVEAVPTCEERRSLMQFDDDVSTGRSGTFARFPFGKLSELDTDKLAIFGVSMMSASGRTHRKAGGLVALRQCSADYLSDFQQSPSRTVVDVDTGKKLQLRDSFGGIDLGNLAAPSTAEANILDQIALLIQSVLGARALPVLLGGDINCVHGLLDGFWAAQREPSLLLLSNRLFVSRWNRASIGGDNTKSEVSEKKPRPVSCQVGINGFQSPDAWSYSCHSGGAKIVTADVIHDSGWQSAIEQIDTFIGAQDEVICVIDAAVLDTGYAAGTPDLNVGGLTPRQLVSICSAIEVSGKLSGIALLNVVPELDARGHTEQAITDSAFALFDGLMVEEIIP